MRWSILLLLALLATNGVAAQDGNETVPEEETPADEPPFYASLEVRLGMAALGMIMLIGAFVMVARR